MKSPLREVALSMAMLLVIASAVWGQDVVQYRLALGGTYVAPPLVDDPPFGIHPLSPLGPDYRYVHGNEANGQAFDPAVTPVIRWDAMAVVTGNNYGGANLVIDLAVRSGSVDGPLATEAVFSGDYPDGVAANFSVGVSTSTGKWATITDSVGVGGPNMSIYNRGLASPGQLSGIGAGYVNWGSPQSVRPGVGVAGTLPNGSPGLGHNPTFDGKIDISRLSAGTYYLVLTQGIGVNVLKPELDPTQSTGSFAKGADQHPTASISFVVGNPNTPPTDGGGNGTQPPSDGGGNTGGGDTGGGATGGGQDGTSGGSTGGDSPTSSDQTGDTQTDGTQGDNTQDGSDGQSSTEDAAPPGGRPFAFCGSGSVTAVVGAFLGLMAVPHLRRRPGRTQRNGRS